MQNAEDKVPTSASSAATNVRDDYDQPFQPDSLFATFLFFSLSCRQRRADVFSSTQKQKVQPKSNTRMQFRIIVDLSSIIPSWSWAGGVGNKSSAQGR